MPTIPNIPWRKDVSDDDPCQVVKEQSIGGLYISCRGKCPSRKNPKCKLQKRRAHSRQPWQDLSDPEVGDPNFEYRCICDN